MQSVIFCYFKRLGTNRSLKLDGKICFSNLNRLFLTRFSIIFNTVFLHTLFVTTESKE